ncbi:D-aminoacyl-tRNA deacylase [Aurantivibrio plasticivorans]
MRGLIQRVTHAKVEVGGDVVGAIDQGILLLLGVEKADGQAQLDKLLHRVINYRIFSDEAGKMNRSLLDIRGGILVVSQFTLVADTQKGLRPSFSSAAPPALADQLYQAFVAKLGEYPELQVATGQFAADMQVSLCNDGPVTFWLSA